MKKYDSYKDSGIEWLGMIPRDWKVVRLRYLCDISTGDKDTINREDDGQYPFYVRSKKIERISTFGYDEEAILTPGDGDICKIWHYVQGKFECHQRVYKLSKFKINGKFLYYYLMSNFEKEVFKLSAKSTVDSLRRPMFQNFTVAFGSMSEQEAIAEFLDRKTYEIDTLIKKKKQLIALLKEERTAIINHVVTKGINPDVKYKHSGIDWIGEIPKHWEVKKLKYLGDAFGGLTYSPNDVVDNSDEGVLVLRSSNIQDGRLSLLDNVYVNLRISEKLTLRRGDILICSRNGSQRLIGKNICIDRDMEGNTFGAFMMIFRSAHWKFLKHFFNSSVFTSQSGLFLTVTINQLTSNMINNFYVAFPPSNTEQCIIADYLEKKFSEIDSVINKIEKEIELMQEYKTALISEVVTGKVDIREEVMDMAL